MTIEEIKAIILLYYDKIYLQFIEMGGFECVQRAIGTDIIHY